jgi:hypothetical protein
VGQQYRESMSSQLTNVHVLPQRDKTRLGDDLQHSAQDWLSRFIHKHFVFPRGEFAIVAENGQRISLPTPLLGALIALFVWLAGGTLAGVWLVATISANVANMNNTFMQYELRTETEKKSMQEKIDLLELKVADAREKVIRLDERKKGGS